VLPDLPDEEVRRAGEQVARALAASGSGSPVA
jgi:hypothetical protein